MWAALQTDQLNPEKAALWDANYLVSAPGVFDWNRLTGVIWAAPHYAQEVTCQLIVGLRWEIEPPRSAVRLLDLTRQAIEQAGGVPVRAEGREVYRH